MNTTSLLFWKVHFTYINKLGVLNLLFAFRLTDKRILSTISLGSIRVES